MYAEIFVSLILQLFAIYFFNFSLEDFFYPLQLPTPRPTTHTHDPLHLATLQKFMCPPFLEPEILKNIWVQVTEKGTVIHT